MVTTKTHKDYIEVIGGTAATTKNYREKRYNEYYHKTYQRIVDDMLGEVHQGAHALDVGTSHGNWYSYFKRKGIASVYGVELDPGRAALAKKRGYREVYNCDAANIPHEGGSIDFAFSNDVFVHILQIEDKIAVLKEVERILKKGGIFIFNHTMSRAFGWDGYSVDRYCSFLNLHEFIKIITNNTDFEIVDIKPTYYSFRNPPSPLFRRILYSGIVLPGVVSLLILMDHFYCRHLPIEAADSIYVKLRKSG